MYMYTGIHTGFFRRGGAEAQALASIATSNALRQTVRC